MTPSALIEALDTSFRRTVDELVPWFLEQMPPAYFSDHDRDTQMAHLRAIAAARASGLPLRITLKSEDGASWTFISERDYPGLLAENMRDIPENKPLRLAKVHATRDGSLVLDTFILGDPPRFDEKDPAQAAKLGEILGHAEAKGHAADVAAFAAHLRGTSAEYVRAVTPLRALRTFLRFRDVSGTDDTRVDLEAEDDPKLSRVVILVGNTAPRRFFFRTCTLFGRRGVDIRRAYLDVFDDGKNGFVSMLTFLVQSPEHGPIDPAGPFWATLKAELGRIKWLTETAIDLYGKERHLGLVGAEVVIGLASLAHQVLTRESAYVFAKDRVYALAARHAAHSGAIAELLRERFHPDHPLDDASFEAQATTLHDTIERAVEADDARRVLFTMLAAVKATYRTNVHLEKRYGFALRIDPALLARPEHLERPYGVFFVHGRGFDGFHVRFHDIARGGVRVVKPMGPEQLALETDRLFDEVYGLASAQQLKNKDIPEGGAKGVIVCAPELSTHRVVKGFVDGLLDLIVLTPEVRSRVVDTFGKPEVLYLGPDENITPEHIEWVVDRARRRGYPLAAALMSSKPGAGINHKVYGVTSEGVTVFLDAALKVVGIDPRSQPFTVKLTGGPDGDVAGNEIKILHREYGENARIVGIADGSGAAEDPDGLHHGELLRLVDLSLPIADFDKSKLGPRGAVAKVSDPSGVKLRNTLHNRVVADAFVPAGGRPKTIHADNWQLYLGPDGTPSSKVIIEGANLFLTPEARKKLGEKGVLVIKDSSANKCGVICSSYEISASMILSEEEFLAVKPRFVAEVLDKLRALAKREADLLFREYARAPDLGLPELSVRLSKVVNRAADAIESRLDDLDAADRARAHALVRAHLPAVLVEKAGDRLFAQLPAAYVRSTIAAALATRIVYAEGLDYLASVPEPAIANLAIAYMRREDETRKLIEAVRASSLAEKDQLVRVLERAGTRVALEA